MCGLAGIFTPRSNVATPDKLAAMLAVMSHRGPDGTGQWHSHDHRYQCGFARLAIIDLKTGDQPIVAGEQVLMGNGEIYNYLELRQEFSAYPWQTSGDMEVVLPLLSRMGNDFVHRLNGMYGLALYDSAHHRLTLVRDRLGIKPLYWAHATNGSIVFGSEIKALLASSLVKAEVDETAIASYLAHGWIPAPDTLWRGIYKLPPGHLMQVEADGTQRLERYWHPSPASGLPTDAAEIRQHLTDLLDDAVGLQLRSDVPLGALLSGGIDSGLLVALAARRLDRPLNTYTVRFEGAAVDESPLADLVARRYGTRHTLFDLSMDDVCSHLPRMAWYCDEPLGDASLLPNLLIEEVLGREVRVALNGTGGDELFAGYGRYFPLSVENRYRRIPKALRRTVIEPLIGRIDPTTAWRLSRSDKFLSDRGAYLHEHTTLFPEPLRRAMNAPHLLGPSAQSAHFPKHLDPQTGALVADLTTYLPEDLLLLLDRTSMAASVEGRVPFLDHRLVESALAVPAGIRTPEGRQKALERQMAEPFLPARLLNAPKQGFASPVPAWMRGQLGTLARRLLTSSRALDRKWWNAHSIERFLADPQRHGHRLYSLVMLELTIRIHAEGRFDRAPSEGLEAFCE